MNRTFGDVFAFLASSNFLIQNVLYLLGLAMLIFDVNIYVNIDIISFNLLFELDKI